MFLMLLAAPGVANGQSFTLHGSAGPTLAHFGYSFAAGVGLPLKDGSSSSIRSNSRRSVGRS
jgi:hypothetical protein